MFMFMIVATGNVVNSTFKFQQLRQILREKLWEPNVKRPVEVNRTRLSKIIHMGLV